MSRLRGGAFVFSDAMSRFAASVTSSTARLNAASFALEGRVAPLSLRTNCSADARISSSVAGGSKLASVLMFRHICNDLAGNDRGDISKLSVERDAAYSLIRPFPRNPRLHFEPGCQQRPTAFDVANAGNVVEHDVAFPPLRNPSANLLQLFVRIRRVVALVAMQTPVRELRSERRSNERIHRVNEPEIPAQVEHHVVGPRTAGLPQISYPVLMA